VAPGGDSLLAVYRRCPRPGRCELFAVPGPPLELPAPAPEEPGGSRAGAPLCDPALHDRARWHGLWNAQADCHYAHEHKDDPHQADDLFGPPGAWFGGGEISYPWQTFHGAGAEYPPPPGDPSIYENAAKHYAYGWIVRREIPRLGRAVWIRDVRLQYHALSAPPGTVTRFHSFSLEARICDGDGCGLLRTGGWLDFGHLEVLGPFGAILSREEIESPESGRRRLHYHYPDLAPILSGAKAAEFFWYGRPHGSRGDPDEGTPTVSIALATGDAWSNVDPEEPQKVDLFCPDQNCHLNGSTIQAHVVGIRIPERPGFVAYLDRYGKPAPGCAAPGLDCVPLVAEGLPAGDLQFRDDTDLCLPSTGERDFDVSPPGEWWIRFPN
jgi:hypothetical protein